METKVYTRHRTGRFQRFSRNIRAAYRYEIFAGWLLTYCRGENASFHLPAYTAFNQSKLRKFDALVQGSDGIIVILRFVAVVFVLLALESGETGLAALFDPAEEVLIGRIQRLQ